MYATPRSENMVFRQVLTPAGVSPRRTSEIQLTEAIVELVKAGVGISVLARWAVLPHLEAGTLHAMPLTRTGFHRQWKARGHRRDCPRLHPGIHQAHSQPAGALSGGARLELQRSARRATPGRPETKITGGLRLLPTSSVVPGLPELRQAGSAPGCCRHLPEWRWLRRGVRQRGLRRCGRPLSRESWW